MLWGKRLVYFQFFLLVLPAVCKYILFREDFHISVLLCKTVSGFVIMFYVYKGK